MSVPPAGSDDFRMAGLPAGARRRLVHAAQAISLGLVGDAEQRLSGLLAVHPDHPEVLRMFGGLQILRGDCNGAMKTLERAIELRPDDAAYWSSYGSAFVEASRYDEAIAALRRACELDPLYTTAWYNLGLALICSMRVDEAEVALRRAVSQQPGLEINARVVLGEMLRGEGRFDEAIAEYRSVLAIQQHSGNAWWGLAEIKTRPLADADLERLRDAMKQPSASQDDLIGMGFAMAKALDDRGQYAESLAALAEANRIALVRKQWDASAQSAYVDSVLKAFACPPAGATGKLGEEVIFIVSMPRSGSTLTEQVLASHSQVNGGGELSDLPSVLMEECQRLQTPFPQLVSLLDTADWERLGRRYLERTSTWLGGKKRFTDKLPNNWLYVGAIRAMLPGAHVVVCRRDPLETCFSCYRQRLPKYGYTRTFSDLAAAWRDFDKGIKYWSALYPSHVYESIYENLIGDPEARIRDLLAFCDLAFEPSCLEFHKTVRKVQTPSATQVREPLRRNTARAGRYGALLDPLRLALGMPPYSNDAH